MGDPPTDSEDDESGKGLLFLVNLTTFDASKPPTVPERVQKGPTRIVLVLNNARLEVVFQFFIVYIR